MLDEITPVIFSHNEAPNIGRVLERLGWAKDIVVMDSFSDDGTMEIISHFPRARAFQRGFDNAANQLNFALQETNISTDWVLVLDSDHLLSEQLISELRILEPISEIVGYRAPFVYFIFERPLHTSIYPSRIVLFRRIYGRFFQDGHTQRLSIQGKILDLKSSIIHDDRKPLKRWYASQVKYTQLEAEKISKTRWKDLSSVDRIRKTKVLAPLGIFFYCLFFKGLVLDGWRGIYYSFQRMLAELLLSLRLIGRDLQK